jgi:hypothetical protein
VRQKLIPLLTNAVRSVAYQRAEKVVVIYDYATSVKPRTWELNFHAVNAFQAIGKSLKAQNAGSSACIDVYGLNGNVSLSAGFVIAPEYPRPNQFHGRYTATTPSAQLASVTVIREDCRTVPVTVNLSGTIASVAINGASAITFDQRSVKLPN